MQIQSRRRRKDWLFWNFLDTCNANPIPEKKKGLIVLEFSRHMQCKSNPGEKEILAAKQPTVSCFQKIIISFVEKLWKEINLWNLPETWTQHSSLWQLWDWLNKNLSPQQNNMKVKNHVAAIQWGHNPMTHISVRLLPSSSWKNSAQQWEASHWFHYLLHHKRMAVTSFPWLSTNWLHVLHHEKQQGQTFHD